MNRAVHINNHPVGLGHRPPPHLPLQSSSNHNSSAPQHSTAVPVALNSQTAPVGKWPRMVAKESGPVKAACLSCRQKKAKCDGLKPVCGQCQRKHLECIYIKSKRGGARKRRNPQAPTALAAYLKRLDGLMAPIRPDLHHPDPREGDDPTNVVRTFSSYEEILRCYYNELHSYLTLMPPRHYLVDVLPTLLPESPFILAIQAVLTLNPHPLDPAPGSEFSRRMRNAASAALARQAMASIGRILATTTSLEVVQALIILGTWEWGTTGDAEVAFDRMRQATQICHSMGILNMDRGGTGSALEGIDWRMDMTRRTWWLLYQYQTFLSMVSGQPPIMGPDQDNIFVDFPVCSDKDHTWQTWINGFRQCVRIGGLVMQMMGEQASGRTVSDATHHAMVDADKQIMDLIKDAERMGVVEQVPGGEEEVVQNQQMSLRFALAVTHIHIHRHQAFPEVSLFSRRICGLPSAEEDDDGSRNSDDFARSQSQQSSIPSSAFDNPMATSARFTPTPEPQSGGAYPGMVGPGGHHFVPSGSPSIGVVPPSAHTESPPFGRFQPGLTSTPPGRAGYPHNGLPSVSPPTTLGNMPQTPGRQIAPMPVSSMPLAAADPNRPPSLPPLPFSESEPLFSVDQMMAHLGSSPKPHPAVHGLRTSPNANEPWSSPPEQQRGQGRSSYGGYGSSPGMPPVPLGAPPFNPALQQQWPYSLQEGIMDDVWNPESHPGYLPQPWFAQPGGAAALVMAANSGDQQPGPAVQYPPGNSLSVPSRSSVTRSATDSVASASTNGSKPHKAWGVDEKGDLVPNADVAAAEIAGSFPPGLSLARCATAAHTVIRLEVLHHSAAVAMGGTPKWLPFCACGLVGGAFAFLLLVLAVQAESAVGEFSTARNDEVEALLTNVRVILGGLEAYGVVWEHINVMANEIRAALEAVPSLPFDMQSQNSGISGIDVNSSGSSMPPM